MLKSIFRRTLIIYFFIFSLGSVSAQYNVKFVVSQRPSLHSVDTIYIAGNFNNWNPSGRTYQFKNTNSETFLALQLPPGNYEYKFTRGGWGMVETTKDGKDVSNRTLTVRKDTVINISINGWSDDFKSETAVRKHTASSHVSILDSAFNMPQLNRTRKIWIYLLDDYATTKKGFPVLYMHDGQNLFDQATSAYGEWGVDECLDSLFKQGKKECIVIGIDNGAKRMTEYNPYELKPYGIGEGDKYVDFLVKTLKPYIDKNFRTLSNKKNTFIAGSSMGGLISMYAVIKYPSVFGGAGIFSPSFWVSKKLEEDLKKTGKKINSNLFFYVGGKEGKEMLSDMRKIEADIKSISASKIYETTDPGAEHSEAAWRKYFPEFYNWIMN